MGLYNGQLNAATYILSTHMTAAVCCGSRNHRACLAAEQHSKQAWSRKDGAAPGQPWRRPPPPVCSCDPPAETVKR